MSISSVPDPGVTEQTADLYLQVARWLRSNEKAGADVRWGRFPLGMVARWIERAEEAEGRLSVLEAERDKLAEALHAECHPEWGECYAPQPLIDILGLGRCSALREGEEK